MNIRKKLIAGAMAFGLLASVIAPSMTSAQTVTTSPDTVYVDVSVGSGGTFSALFCAEHAYALTTTQQPQAFVPGYAHGQLGICYIDTMNHRAGFTSQIQSSNFTYTGSYQNTPIGAANLAIVHSYNVLQDHFSSEANFSIFHGHPGKIGDIGHYVNNAYPSSQAGADWTSMNQLDSVKTVGFGWQGIGTGSSTAFFDVTLTIPGGSSPGAYSSTLTLTIMPSPTHSIVRP